MATADGPTPAAGLVERMATAPLGPEARALLTADQSAAAYVEALLKAGFVQDAVRATAFALPRREAVWWAVRCVRSVPAAVPDAPAAAALDAAAKWAAGPSDELRRSTFAAAEAAGVGTPAGAVGAAVFFAEGSLAPPRQAVVAPDPRLCPTTLANAALLAAVASEPESVDERLRAMVGVGAEIAAGRDRWPESAPAPLVARPPSPQPAPTRPPYPPVPPPRRPGPPYRPGG